MTDGLWNDGRHPLDAAEDARDNGIVIHVVAFLPGAQSTDAAAVASTTGGIYVHANNQAELTAAFRKIARVAAPCHVAPDRRTALPFKRKPLIKDLKGTA